MSGVIFVDFFDTIMFRKIHSFQLLPQWEVKLKTIYPELISVDLINLRKDCIKKFEKIEYEIKYENLIRSIYDKLVLHENFSVPFEEFYHNSYKTELYIDYATQYPNKKIIKYLKNQYKLKKEIYIVSDYNLPKEAYEIYLEQYNLNYLFKGIFSSSDFESSKHNGHLYNIVADVLQINMKDVLMIGDSKHSDVDMALKSGIGKAKHYFPLAHKLQTNSSRKLNISFSTFGKKYLFKKGQKSDCFLEYAIPLYFAVEKIYDELLKSNCNQDVLFLSRGGYFLQKLFNEYQKGKTIKFNTIYFKNSRFVNKLTYTNEEQQQILEKYLDDNSKENRLFIVDEGWNCSSQLFFTNKYGYKTNGYYLGTFINDANQNALRKGVLFNINSDGSKSKYYGIFRTNCTFYEQILTAPHGSLKSYKMNGEKVEFIEEWNEKEKNLYINHTKEIQKKLMHLFCSIDAWNIRYSEKYIAHKLIYTLLFSNRNRLALLQKYDASYYDNMGKQSKAQQNIKEVHITLKSLICFPEDNMRFFCKLKELFYKKKIYVLYYPVGLCIYLYTKIVLFIKENKQKNS